ncbi:hypothetical protein Bca52824_061891 [Brassica carinata]|uniref:Uncharacterized protein n=1 Tax=Brassica carinata TaxID=52824 RepID=A0A8X7U8W1_BRACI|nr:hypothetical protein Bca52824_061891 [Brassica carinata]
MGFRFKQKPSIQEEDEQKLERNQPEDVVAGFVAMEAEVAQQEVKTRAWSLECKSPSKKAFMLGLIALGCLLAAHFITVMIGCIISAINIADRLPGFEHTTSRRIHMACISLTWVVVSRVGGRELDGAVVVVRWWCLPPLLTGE